MSDFVFNIAKGRHAHYASLPGTNDALVLVLLKTAEADAALKDHDTLTSILGGTSDEADFTGYARRTLASVTVTVDDTDDEVVVDAADPAAYTNSGGSAQNCPKGVICYDPDTTTGDDDDLIPLYGVDLGGSGVTFDPGVATTVQFNASGVAVTTDPA